MKNIKNILKHFSTSSSKVVLFFSLFLLCSPVSAETASSNFENKLISNSPIVQIFTDNISVNSLLIKVIEKHLVSRKLPASLTLISDKNLFLEEIQKGKTAHIIITKDFDLITCLKRQGSLEYNSITLYFKEATPSKTQKPTPENTDGNQKNCLTLIKTFQLSEPKTKSNIYYIAKILNEDREEANKAFKTLTTSRKIKNYISKNGFTPL